MLQRIGSWNTRRVRSPSNPTKVQNTFLVSRCCIYLCMQSKEETSSMGDASTNRSTVCDSTSALHQLVQVYFCSTILEWELNTVVVSMAHRNLFE
jgi:hypothetical protein